MRSPRMSAALSAIHAISGVDLALWDLMGKAWGLPVYKLLGGETKPRVPSYITCKPPYYIEPYVAFGYTKIKLALPYGPADGRAGITDLGGACRFR